MRYIVGIILIGIGIICIVFTEWLLENFGRIAWAENKLGAEGGTRIFYKLLGIGFIILSFTFISGRLFSVIEWIFVHGTGNA